MLSTSISGCCFMMCLWLGRMSRMFCTFISIPLSSWSSSAVSAEVGPAGAEPSDVIPVMSPPFRYKTVSLLVGSIDICDVIDVWFANSTAIIRPFVNIRIGSITKGRVTSWPWRHRLTNKQTRHFISLETKSGRIWPLTYGTKYDRT